MKRYFVSKLIEFCLLKTKIPHKNEVAFLIILYFKIDNIINGYFF